MNLVLLKLYCQCDMHYKFCWIMYTNTECKNNLYIDPLSGQLGNMTGQLR